MLFLGAYNGDDLTYTGITILLSSRLVYPFCNMIRLSSVISFLIIAGVAVTCAEQDPMAAMNNKLDAMMTAHEAFVATWTKELQQTKDELSQTKDELSQTEDKLSQTEDKLLKVEDELQQTKLQLQKHNHPTTFEEIEAVKRNVGQLREIVFHHTLTFN
jgi:septal ring factor EnvC (AmiA/AmiB activator)